jgi:uncharacterized protein (TIGR00730 family)
MNIISRLYLTAQTAVHFIYTMGQVARGVWEISALPGPTMTIFGGARFGDQDHYALQAHALANRLAHAGISVLTGGGSGIMEAASCGFIEKSNKGRVIGIGVSELKEKKNRCVNSYFEVRYFFARKWLLTHYSDAFAVFPGGYGTLDELGEVLLLAQLFPGKKTPIVLFGSEYWQPFIAWLSQQLLAHGAISAVDLELFVVTDVLDVAFNTLCKKTES